MHRDLHFLPARRSSDLVRMQPRNRPFAATCDARHPLPQGEPVLRKLRKFLPALIAVVSMASVAQSVKTHHVREAVRSGHAQAIGRLPANQVLQLDLVLPLRDPAGLKSFLSDIATSW